MTVADGTVDREAMLAEMGIALREDCSVMGVYTPRKVSWIIHAYASRAQYRLFHADC